MKKYQNFEDIILPLRSLYILRPSGASAVQCAEFWLRVQCL